MKIVHKHKIFKEGAFAKSIEVVDINKEIEDSILAISWPQGESGFYLDPHSKGKKRGEGNGVKPIKEACVTLLKSRGWKEEFKVRKTGVAGTGPLDIVKETPYGLFALEWETGNISSSHRALNKMALGLLRKELIGGALILPSTELYPFLTDRIGNFRELIPYLALWESLPYVEGYFEIFVVEQDGLREGVPRIPKGTDGRALI